MKFHWILLILCLSNAYGWDYKERIFPDVFRFGVSTGAFQHEGAWDKDGKSPSVWDDFLHKHPEIIADGRNGDQAADTYSNIERDIEMLRELGADYYRFSMSWTRLLPTGLAGNVSETAVAYYDLLLNQLKNYYMEPMVVMYYHDLPLYLQNLGGWANPLIVQWFEDYARVLFERFSTKVKYWITINDPSRCFEMYGGKNFAPNISSSGIGDYLCVKNMMIAHAKVYRIYADEYKPKMRVPGMLGLSAPLNWVDPLNPNKTEDIEAADLYRDFAFNLYIHPIWSKEGDWPKKVKDIVAKKSKEDGFIYSRLPTLSPEEIKLLKNSADFIGMNHYTTHQVRPLTPTDSAKTCILPIIKDASVCLSQGDLWKKSKSKWLKGASYGLYRACLYLNKYYNYPPIIITEHGWSTGTGIKDTSRVLNMKEYMKAILFSLEDGTDLRGLTTWSLMDGIEWTAGTSERFGIYEVDFDSPEKTRTPRLSALFLRHVIHSRMVDLEWQPENMSIAISDRRQIEKTKKTEL